MYIYNALKHSPTSHEQRLLKEMDPEIIACYVQFFRNIILNDVEVEYKFSQILKDDIALLSDKRDLTYVTHFLVPLLNSDKLLSICLHPFDRFN